MACDCATGLDLPAWVQAIGSIAAIIVSAVIAIVVERRGAGRMERARRNEANVSVDARLGAVAAVRRAVADLANEVEALDLSEGPRRISDATMGALQSARRVLSYYLNTGAPAPLLVIDEMVKCSQVFPRLDMLLDAPVIDSAAYKNQVAEALRQVSAAIE